MPLQRFLSLRNSANGILEGKIVNIMFWGEGYGSRPTQEIAPEAGAVTRLHTIGVQGYFSSVQPPLSEIPGSAPEDWDSNRVIIIIIITNYFLYLLFISYA